MILTGKEIHREILEKRITIEPFNPKNLNPNSYNYHLGNVVKISSVDLIDAARNQIWEQIEIPVEGLVLEPYRLYLGHTLEHIGSATYVTSLIGRSSVGRLGLHLQLSADLGQLGAIHAWTLEMTVVQPMRIFAGMIIGQVSFWSPLGAKFLYQGEYSRTSLPQESQVTEG
jgi:dCTP deaminase